MAVTPGNWFCVMLQTFSVDKGGGIDVLTGRLFKLGSVLAPVHGVSAMVFKGMNRGPSALLCAHLPFFGPILVRIGIGIALRHPERIAAVSSEKRGAPSAKTAPAAPSGGVSSYTTHLSYLDY